VVISHFARGVARSLCITRAFSTPQRRPAKTETESYINELSFQFFVSANNAETLITSPGAVAGPSSPFETADEATAGV